MATAAIVVLLMALYPPARSQSEAANVPAQTARPSPFGAAAASSTTPPDIKLTPPQIAKAGGQAVVIVTGYDSNDQPLSQANGYVYSSSGIIVTSYSAIRGASSVTIETSHGDELNVIALMGYSSARDLAVLGVLEGNLTALEAGAGDNVEEGESVLVIGPNHSVSQGAIGQRRAIGGVDLMQLNTQASPGSPVVNEHGKVIGVIIKRAAGVNASLAIPSHYISDIIAEHHPMSFAKMLEETRPPAAPPSGGAPTAADAACQSSRTSACGRPVLR